MVAGPTTDGFHHPALAEVLGVDAEPHAVGVEAGTSEKVRLPSRVVHHQVGGGMAHEDQPVPRAGGPIHRTPVDGAAGHWDAAGDLLLDQLEVAILHQPGGDAVVGQGLELGARVGGVAVALHHRQVGVVAIGARKRAGLDGLQEHGAAGEEAGAIPLAQLDAVPLLEVGQQHRQAAQSRGCNRLRERPPLRPAQARSVPGLRAALRTPHQGAGRGGLCLRKCETRS